MSYSPCIADNTTLQVTFGMQAPHLFRRISGPAHKIGRYWLIAWCKIPEFLMRYLGILQEMTNIFDLLTLTLNVGDTVELDVFKDAAAQAGFFVGTNLTIDLISVGPYPVPEPVSLSLLAAG